MDVQKHFNLPLFCEICHLGRHEPSIFEYGNSILYYMKTYDDNTLFFIYLIFKPKKTTNFLQSTQILSFYIDVIFAISNSI